MIEIISDWCFACAQIEEMWEEASNSVKKVGVGIGIININRSPRLADALGVGRVPSIIGVINGRVMFYSEMVTVQGLKDFVLGLFPHGLIEKVTARNLDFFLTTSISNKPSIVLFSPKPRPSLLYHLVAFGNHKRQSFGFVSLTDSSSEPLRKRFRVNLKEPTVLIFKEEVAVPDVVVKASELKHGKLREVVESHKYLHLPRLSSRSLFDELCPEERFRSHRRLCVVLFTKQGQHKKEKLALRLLATDNKFLSERRVKFLYIYEGVQRDFVEEFKDGVKEDSCAENKTASKVLVLWNKGQRKVRYDWLPGGWCVNESEGPLTKTRLSVMLEDLLSGEGKLRYTSSIPRIYNEHAPGLLSMLFSWCSDAYYYVKSSLYRRETISLFSLLCGVGVILVFSVLLPSANEPIDRVYKASSKKNQRPLESESVLGLLRLDHSTEKTLIRDAPRGQITFTLLVDATTTQEVVKLPLIQAYADLVYPYSRNPNFKFTWLSIPDNLAWCAEILDVDKFGEVTPGIVLALNGYKKYLSVFKPTDLSERAFFKRQGGNLMGFDDTDSDSDPNEDGMTEYERKRQKVLSLSIRTQLVHWLERFCDGMTDRKRIVEWPKFTN